VLAETERKASLLLLHISNMDTYAILDKKGGWLVNLVVWNGNLEDWQPPAGTEAKLASEIDLHSLPERPSDGF
jgi:hypothetical protein